MADEELIAKIGQLADEERKLEEAHVGSGLSEEEKDRLHKIEVTLDQLWDLLRQRRALRGSHTGSPDEASTRDESVVERYVQ